MQTCLLNRYSPKIQTPVVEDYQQTKKKVSAKRYGGLTWEQLKTKRGNQKFNVYSYMGSLKDFEMRDVERLLDEEKYQKTNVKTNGSVSDSIYKDAISEAIFSPRARGQKAIFSMSSKLPMSPKGRLAPLSPKPLSPKS